MFQSCGSSSIAVARITPPDAGHARIAFPRLQRTGRAFGVVVHRSKLQRAKDTAIAADAILRVEHRTAVFELDRRGEQDPERQRNARPDDASDGIEGALHRRLAISSQSATNRSAMRSSVKSDRTRATPAAPSRDRSGAIRKERFERAAQRRHVPGGTTRPVSPWRFTHGTPDGTLVLMTGSPAGHRFELHDAERFGSSDRRQHQHIGRMHPRLHIAVGQRTWKLERGAASRPPTPQPSMLSRIGPSPAMTTCTDNGDAALMSTSTPL